MKHGHHEQLKLKRMLITFGAFWIFVLPVLAFSTWAWRILHYPIPAPPAVHMITHLISGYDRNWRLRSFSPIDPSDCVPAVNDCRSQIAALGGGVCMVPPRSLRLKNTPLTRAPYWSVGLDVERPGRLVGY
jgi:hypothetical protein